MHVYVSEGGESVSPAWFQALWGDATWQRGKVRGSKVKRLRFQFGSGILKAVKPQ